MNPKTYLDNLDGCKFCGMMENDGERASMYLYKGRSIVHSLSWSNNVKDICHVVSFCHRRDDGAWYMELVSEMEKRFGKPDFAFWENGIQYFLWKEAKE